jgi:integrase
MEAMPYAEVPALMAQLAAAVPTTGRDALRFTIYNAVRSNETRFAVWTEFDLEKAIWTIPGERMKARETHVVPLSPHRLWHCCASAGMSGPAIRAWSFPTTAKKPISDMTMTKLLRNDGFTSITVHGFRSTFTDWAAEKHGLSRRKLPTRHSRTS